MESFEQFVAVAMEAEGLIISEAVKFPVQRQTRKLAHDEIQTHGYEVDLIGARGDRLVLATVKSFLGSRGVVAEHVMGTGGTYEARRAKSSAFPSCRSMVRAMQSMRTRSPSRTRAMGPPVAASGPA